MLFYYYLCIPYAFTANLLEDRRRVISICYYFAEKQASYREGRHLSFHGLSGTLDSNWSVLC
jgi:hypothetical protein